MQSRHFEGIEDHNLECPIVILVLDFDSRQTGLDDGRYLYRVQAHPANEMIFIDRGHRSYCSVVTRDGVPVRIDSAHLEDGVAVLNVDLESGLWGDGFKGISISSGYSSYADRDAA